MYLPLKHNASKVFFSLMSMFILGVLFWFVESLIQMHVFESARTFQIAPDLFLKASVFPFLWFLFVAMVVDFLGPRKSFFVFVLGGLLFAGMLRIFPQNYFSFTGSVELFLLAELFFFFWIFKAAAVYLNSKGFYPFFVLVYVVSSLAVYCRGSLPLVTKLSHLLANCGGMLNVAIGFSLVLLALSYYFHPSRHEEKIDSTTVNFFSILAPFYQVKTWPAMLSLGLLLAFLTVVFKFMVSLVFPGLLHIQNAYRETIFLFGLGSIVGVVLYPILFKKSVHLGRITGLSLACMILCLLGVGFLSMSEELIFCLVALSGVFMGSIVLLAKALLDRTSSRSYAVALAVSVIISIVTCGILYAFFLHAGYSNPLQKAFLIKVWWFGLGLLFIAMVSAFLTVRQKKMPEFISSPVSLGSLFKSYWRGEETLASTFWKFSVIGRWLVMTGLFSVLFFIAFRVTNNTLSAPLFAHHFDWLVLLLAGFLWAMTGFVLSFVMLVSVWRSAKKSRWIWRYLSRVIALLSFVRNLIFVTILILGLYFHAHPQLLEKWIGSLHLPGLSQVKSE